MVGDEPLCCFSCKAATLVSRVSRRSLARILPSLDLKNKMDCSQSDVLPPNQYFLLFFNYILGHQCQNGATCDDGIAQYTCKCSAGFEGPLCRNNTDDCVSAVCLNNATCVDQIANYTCNCSLGFTGEQNITLPTYIPYRNITSHEIHVLWLNIIIGRIMSLDTANLIAK